MHAPRWRRTGGAERFRTRDHHFRCVLGPGPPPYRNGRGGTCTLSPAPALARPRGACMFGPPAFHHPRDVGTAGPGQRRGAGLRAGACPRPAFVDGGDDHTIVATSCSAGPLAWPSSRASPRALRQWLVRRHQLHVNRGVPSSVGPAVVVHLVVLNSGDAIGVRTLDDLLSNAGDAGELRAESLRTLPREDADGDQLTENGVPWLKPRSRVVVLGRAPRSPLSLLLGHDSQGIHARLGDATGETLLHSARAALAGADRGRRALRRAARATVARPRPAGGAASRLRHSHP